MKRSTKDDRWVGKAVVDANGAPAGTLDAVAGGTKEWPDVALVDVGGEAGTRRVVALPADRARIEKHAIRLPYLRDEIHDALEVDADGKDVPDDILGGLRADLDGSIDDDEGMVVSEEQLVAERVTKVADRAVVRKVVVTEEVTITVPLRREDVRVDRIEAVERTREVDGKVVEVERPDAVDQREDAVAEDYFDAPDEQDVELVLYAEEPIVTARVVPIERVRVGKAVVTEDTVLAGEVRKERVEVVTEGQVGPLETEAEAGLGPVGSERTVDAPDPALDGPRER